MIGGVKERCVGIRDFNASANKLRWNTPLSLHRSVAHVEELHCFAGPDSPMTEKAADDEAFDDAAVRREHKRSEQIHHDVVIVAGIEGDVEAGFGDSPHDIEG